MNFECFFCMYFLYINIKIRRFFEKTIDAYFKREKLEATQNWYETVAMCFPSTSNGIESNNRNIFFFHMFTVKRLHRLTDYKESSPEGLSMLNMLPPFLRLNLVTAWVLYFSPFRYQFYWLVYKSNVSVKCLAQEHNIVVIFARRSPTLNQIRLDVAYLL
jgi:hypothetical protein